MWPFYSIQPVHTELVVPTTSQTPLQSFSKIILSVWFPWEWRPCMYAPQQHGSSIPTQLPVLGENEMSDGGVSLGMILGVGSPVGTPGCWPSPPGSPPCGPRERRRRRMAEMRLRGLVLVGLVRGSRAPPEHSALTLRPFPPRSEYLGSFPGQRRSWRAGGWTRRRNWELGCSRQKCVSSCAGCRSSWSCVWKRRRPGPGRKVSCSSLR